MMIENWNKLTPREKFDARFKDWMSAPGIQFASPEIERAYDERTQLFRDAVQLKKPKRVPIHIHAGFYPVNYAGYTAEEVMYDYAKLGKAFKKFNSDFLPDALASSLYTGSAKVFQTLDLKLYCWAGHGVPSTAPYQCVEAEYMRADEYDLLIADPTGYFIRYYLPRIFGALSPWQKLSPLTDLTEFPFMGANLVAFGSPDVQEAFEKLLEAGRAALEWMKHGGAINAASVASLGLAPFTAARARSCSTSFAGPTRCSPRANGWRRLPSRWACARPTMVANRPSQCHFTRARMVSCRMPISKDSIGRRSRRR